MNQLSVAGIRVLNPRYEEAVSRMLRSPYLKEVSQVPGKPYVRAEFEKDGKTIVRAFDTKKGNYSAASETKFVSKTTERPGKDEEQNALMILDHGNNTYTKYTKPVDGNKWTLVAKQGIEQPRVFEQSVNMLNWLSKDFVAQL